MRAYILILLCLVFSSTYTHSQGKFEFDVGAGFFEAISLKAKYGTNTQIGLAQGFIGTDPFQSSIELYYHFKRNVEPEKMSPFYLMGGLGSTFLSQKYQNHITTFYPRLGFTIRFSQTTGINLDIGYAFFQVRDTDGGYNYDSSLSGSIHFFIKV